MIRLMRRLFWLTAAGGVAAGGWTFWKLRGNNDELPQGNWSPVPNTSSGAANTSASGTGSERQGFAGSAANSSAATSGSTSTAAAKTASASKQTSAKSTPATAKSASNGTDGTGKSAAGSTADSSASKSTGSKTSASKASASKAPASKTSASKTSASKAASADGQKWVAPDDNGSCPADFAVKANDGSKIYHVPTGRSYKRTKAERCYATPEDAAADGYRAAKA